MDGYLRYRFKTNYLIGTWYLGAIIIIYIMYPLLSLMMNLNILTINFIVSLGYIFMNKTNYFIIIKHRNIITCVNSFYFGMLTIKGKNLFIKKKISFIIFLILFLILYFFKFKESLLIYQIQGFSYIYYTYTFWKLYYAK